MVVILGLLCVWVPPALTAPAKTYDQRQQGDLNIHAQLDNIVVLVIPTARLNLLDLALDNKVSGEKGGFFQFLQKLNKADIDRYVTVKEEEEPKADMSAGEVEIDIRRPIPVITTSQQVSLNHEDEIEEKEEEVVATVEEMKPETTLNPTEVPKSELTEDSVAKEEHVIEVKQESVLNVSVPKEETNSAKDEDKKVKESAQTENDNEKETKPRVEQDINIKSSNELEKTSDDKSESPGKVSSKSEIDDSTKQNKPEVTSVVKIKEERQTIEDYIKPVAAKEEITPASSVLGKTQPTEEHPLKKVIEPVRLQEGVRKEKVIRYKPEAKWAPELVDLLGPPRPKPKDLQERHMFADLCSPGAWDPELRTCIMPGETRR